MSNANRIPIYNTRLAPQLTKRNCTGALAVTENHHLWVAMFSGRPRNQGGIDNEMPKARQASTLVCTCGHPSAFGTFNAY